MWDNGCVLHRADHAGVVGDRVMHRGMVTDYDDRDTSSSVGRPHCDQDGWAITCCLADQAGTLPTANVGCCTAACRCCSRALRCAIRSRRPRHVADRPKTILISGGKMTKSLQLARTFHAPATG